MLTSFSTLCCLDYSAAEIIDLAKRTAMDGVEFRLDDKRLLALDDFGAVAEQFRKSGVFVTNIAASISITSDTVKDIHYRYIDLASAMGVKGVRIFAGNHVSAIPDTLQSDLPGIIRGIQTLCRYAQDKNVEIWLENHSELSTGKLCRAVWDGVNMPNLKMIWDVIHSLEFYEELEETLDYLGDRISHVHLKDGRRGPDPKASQFIHTDLGAGEMPFDRVIALLKQRGYDGYLSLEWESPWRPEIRELYPDPKALLNRYKAILTASGI